MTTMDEILILDGYNVIFAWPALNERDQTADSYIEKLVEQLRRQDKRRVIRVVTGDALEQGTVLSFGAARMTVRELRTRVAQSREGTRAHMEKLQSAKRHELTGRLPQDIADALEVMRRS